MLCMQRHVLELGFRFSVVSSATLNTEFLLPFLFNRLIIFHEVLESLHTLCTFSCAMHYRDCILLLFLLLLEFDLHVSVHSFTFFCSSVFFYTCAAISTCCALKLGAVSVWEAF